MTLVRLSSPGNSKERASPLVTSILFVVLGIGFVGLSLFAKEQGVPLLVNLFLNTVFFGGLALVLVIHRSQRNQMPDEVWYNGDQLYIKIDGGSFQVGISDISSISKANLIQKFCFFLLTGYVPFDRVEIRLRQASPMGDRIVFEPAQFVVGLRNPITHLIRKVSGQPVDDLWLTTLTLEKAYPFAAILVKWSIPAIIGVIVLHFWQQSKRITAVYYSDSDSGGLRYACEEYKGLDRRSISAFRYCSRTHPNTTCEPVEGTCVNSDKIYECNQPMDTLNGPQRLVYYSVAKRRSSTKPKPNFAGCRGDGN